MRPIPFTKIEAVGNDFVLFNAADLPNGLDFSELSRAVCPRGTAIGADGILVVDWPKLRMFNPDGSEDVCGNGMRCAAVYAQQNGWVQQSGILQHPGEIPFEITRPNHARVLMPAGTFDPSLVRAHSKVEIWEQPFLAKVGQKYSLYSLSTGSTHTIIFCDTLPAEDEFIAVSMELEDLPLFPDRTSIMWTQIIAENALKIRIWERGAGETLGCGTGSSAAAIVYARKYDKKGEIIVNNPGGPLKITLSDWSLPYYSESEVKIAFTGMLHSELVAKIA